MKTRLLNILYLVAFLLVGCEGLDPGADAFAVRSQQSIQIAFDTVDGFVKWEYQNRSILPYSVTHEADVLRNQFPPAHESALAVLDTYKATRSASDKQKVSEWIALLQKMADEANKARPKN